MVVADDMEAPQESPFPIFGAIYFEKASLSLSLRLAKKDLKMSNIVGFFQFAALYKIKAIRNTIKASAPHTSQR